MQAFTPLYNTTTHTCEQAAGAKLAVRDFGGLEGVSNLFVLWGHEETVFGPPPAAVYETVIGMFAKLGGYEGMMCLFLYPPSLNPNLFLSCRYRQLLSILWGHHTTFGFY